MSVQNLQQSSQRDRFMNEQQFEKVVEAILAGRYSWACVLILQSAGYNPLHYIPYRTYNRLLKDNCLKQRENYHQEEVPRPIKSTPKPMSDLSYLDRVGRREGAKITAGNGFTRLPTLLNLR